jgi:hypothetical protein
MCDARAVLARDDVDESHERKVAVDDGAGSANDFDALDLFDRNLQRGGVDAAVAARHRDRVDEDLHVADVEWEVEAAHEREIAAAVVASVLNAGHESERFAGRAYAEGFELVAFEDGDDAGNVVAVEARLRRDCGLLLHDRQELFQLLVVALRLLFGLTG